MKKLLLLLFPKLSMVKVNYIPDMESDINVYTVNDKQTNTEVITLQQLLDGYTDVKVGTEFAISLHSIVTNAYNNGMIFQHHNPTNTCTCKCKSTK